jgi:hypothetical protein
MPEAAGDDLGQPKSGTPVKPPYARLSAEQRRQLLDQVDNMIRHGIIKAEAPSDPADAHDDATESSRNEESHPADDSRSSMQVGAGKDAATATGKVGPSLRAPIYYWQWLGIVAMALLFGVFVWPTPFEYRIWQEESWSSFLRISRFSGRVEGFTGRGWVQLGQQGAPAPTTQMVPSRGSYADILAELDSLEAEYGKSKPPVGPKR